MPPVPEPWCCTATRPVEPFSMIFWNKLLLLSPAEAVCVTLEQRFGFVGPVVGSQSPIEPAFVSWLWLVPPLAFCVSRCVTLAVFAALLPVAVDWITFARDQPSCISVEPPEASCATVWVI